MKSLYIIITVLIITLLVPVISFAFESPIIIVGRMWEDNNKTYNGVRLEGWVGGTDVRIYFDHVFGQNYQAQVINAGFFVTYAAPECKWGDVTVTITHPMYETFQITEYIDYPEIYSPWEIMDWMQPVCSQEYSVKVIGPIYQDTDRLGQGPFYIERINFYQNLQDAYNEAEDGSTILLNANFVYNLYLDIDKDIVLIGGYDCVFENATGITRIENISIELGGVTMENIQIGGND